MSSLRRKTVNGVIWLGLQSLATRIVVVLQQLALGWLLAKQDFGLFGLAFSISSLVSLLANPGIDAVLIQRPHKFQRWATPAFWLGLTAGILGMVAMFVAAPVAAWIYGEPRLTGLIIVLAFSAPLQTLLIVPKAKLQAELRYRSVVLLLFLNNLLVALLTVAAALLGFGAYSFVVPTPITAVIIATIAWIIARPRIHLRLGASRWKYLLHDGIAMGGSRFLNSLISQGDYICLGLAQVPGQAIGTYVFAYSVAIQAFRVIASSADTILFPSLSQVAIDRDLQIRSTLRAARLLTLISVPFCLLQILLAEPIFRLVFPARWHDAVPLLQILTFGVLLNAPCWPAASLMMAQRRFHDAFRLSAICAAGFFAMVSIAAFGFRSIDAVAIAVTACYAWASPYSFWSAFYQSRPATVYFTELYRFFLSGFLAALSCIWIWYGNHVGRIADVTAIIGSTMLFSTNYLILILLCARSDTKDFWHQISTLVGQLSRQPKASKSYT